MFSYNKPRLCMVRPSESWRSRHRRQKLVVTTNNSESCYLLCCGTSSKLCSPEQYFCILQGMMITGRSIKPGTKFDANNKQPSVKRVVWQGIGWSDLHVKGVFIALIRHLTQASFHTNAFNYCVLVNLSSTDTVHADLNNDSRPLLGIIVLRWSFISELLNGRLRGDWMESKWLVWVKVKAVQMILY